MSELEETLAFHLKAAKLPAPEREYRFDPERRWRFDFAWPDQMLAVEGLSPVPSAIASSVHGPCFSIQARTWARRLPA